MSSNRPLVLMINMAPATQEKLDQVLRNIYSSASFVAVADLDALVSALTTYDLDVAIVDCDRGEEAFLASLRVLREQRPDLPTLALIPLEQELLSVQAVVTGVDDYLLKTPHVYERLPDAFRMLLERSTQRHLFAISQGHYRRLFANAPVGLFRCTVDGRLLAVNPALGRILGEENAEVLHGQNLALLFEPAEDVGEWFAADEEAGGVVPREVQLRRKDGVVVWARVKMQAVRDVAENMLYFEGSVEDITEQRLTQQALNESEEKLRLIFENAFDGISIHEEVPESGSRRLLECNERYAEMAGYSVEELLRIGNTSQLQKKVSRKFSRAENLFIRQHKVRYRGLFSWIRPDGRENVIEYSAAPIDVDGRPLTIGIDRDITARIRSQEEAQRRAAHLEALNRIIRAGAVAKHSQELAEQVVQQVAHAFQADWVVLWIGDTLVSEGLTEAVAGAWRAQADAEGLANVFFETELTETDEEKRTRLWAPIFHESRQLGGFVVQAAEVEDWPHDALALAQVVAEEVGAAVARLRLMEQVQTQLQQMQMLMDAAPEGIILLDHHQQIVLVNPAAQEILQAIGATTAGALRAFGSLSLDALLQENGSGSTREVHISDPPLILELATRPITAQGRPEGWLLLVRNVTAERERQQRSEQQGRLAAVGQLAAGIAHDFNNTLAVILLLVQMLIQEDGLPERSRDRLETIERQAKHASTLIHQILDFSRKSILTWTTGDLAELVRETTVLLSRTLDDNIHVSFDASAGDYRVRADFTRLKQMMMNLAVNARDAMPGGGSIAFQLARVQVNEEGLAEAPDLKPGDWLRLTVTDTGAGIPADVLPHVFEPFFTTKEVGKGTGLGLSQVYGIVKQHGGDIYVSSTELAGTRFVIYLPALPAPKREATGSAPDRADGAVEHTILVVEDNRMLLRALCEVLNAAGHRALAAASGEEALEIFDAADPEVDLILSDMSMPGMNGIELHRALRSRRPTVRTIILSGYPGEREQHNWRQDGIVDWLQKPLSAERLLQRIKEALT